MLLFYLLMLKLFGAKYYPGPAEMQRFSTPGFSLLRNSKSTDPPLACKAHALVA